MTSPDGGRLALRRGRQQLVDAVGAVRLVAVPVSHALEATAALGYVAETSRAGVRRGLERIPRLTLRPAPVSERQELMRPPGAMDGTPALSRALHADGA
ncbi:MAG: hypothetical protein QOF68_183 [Gaiellales bacterium]|nr:hypothetical protein [Gaiellales bacterium]